MAYLAQIVVCVWKQKKRDEKKGMCETCPGLNGKCDGEKPNDRIRFAVGQLISFRLVLQSLRRCFACKIFDFFAMRVKPWADHLIDFVHTLLFQAGEQLNADFLAFGVGFQWFFYRRQSFNLVVFRQLVCFWQQDMHRAAGDVEKSSIWMSKALSGWRESIIKIRPISWRRCCR